MVCVEDLNDELDPWSDFPWLDQIRRDTRIIQKEEYMKRRDTLKSLLVGGVAGATLGTSGCKVDGDKVIIDWTLPVRVSDFMILTQDLKSDEISYALNLTGVEHLKNNNLKSLLKLLISNNYYKKNNFVGSLIINLIELYILKEYKVSETKNSVLKIYHDFINKVHNMKKYNLDEESLFLEFKSKLLNE